MNLKIDAVVNQQPDHRIQSAYTTNVSLKISNTAYQLSYFLMHIFGSKAQHRSSIEIITKTLL